MVRDNDAGRRLLRRDRMRGRPISQGREVSLNGPGNRDFRIMLEALGWSCFALTGGIFFPSLVYEFYADFEYLDGRVYFRMFERSHSYSLYQFGQLLGIHPLFQDGFPEDLSQEVMWRALCVENFTVTHLQQCGVRDDYIRPEWVEAERFIRSNVFHREQTNRMMSDTEQRLLWCLTNGVPVNISHIVASRMSGLHDDPRPLPYGALLTNLFRRIRVVRDDIPSHRISARPLTYEVCEISSDDDTPSLVPESSFDSGGSSIRSDARSQRRVR